MLLRLHRKQLLPLAFAAGFVSGTGAVFDLGHRALLAFSRCALRSLCTVDYF